MNTRERYVKEPLGFLHSYLFLAYYFLTISRSQFLFNSFNFIFPPLLPGGGRELGAMEEDRHSLTVAGAGAGREVGGCGAAPDPPSLHHAGSWVGDSGDDDVAKQCLVGRVH